MLKRVPAPNLRVGMFVVEYGDGSFTAPHVRLDRALNTEAEVESVRSETSEAVIDTELGLDEEAAKPAGPWSAAAGPAADSRQHDAAADDGPQSALLGAPAVPLAEEIHVARRAYNRALDFLSRSLRDIKLGRRTCLREAHAVAGEITESSRRNHRASSSISIVRSHGYVTNHCVNVAFLAAALGARLRLPGGQARTLTLAALLHDVGKVVMPDAILHKPGRLTPEEYARIQEHSRAGHDLLATQPGMPGDVLAAVLDHHEACDGSGYPGRKTAAEIHPLALYLSILDVYDALISYRTYRRARTPYQALKFLYAHRETRFSQPHLAAFIRFIGIYPVGSFVRLDDGCYGLVADFPENRPGQPVVKVVFDRRLRPLRPALVDTGTDGRRVALGLNPKDYRIDTELFFP